MCVHDYTYIRIKVLLNSLIDSITDYMDFNAVLNDSLLLPSCDINFELSEVTLNHFEVSSPS